MTERRTIFVTGAASGIGRAIAIHFGRQGWFVGLGDLDTDGMIQTEEMLPGGYSYAHRFDVRERAQWDEALRVVSTAAGGRIDVVTIGVGSGGGGALTEIAEEELEQAIMGGLPGAIHGARAAYPHLKAAAPGSCLINIAGIAAIYGAPGLAANGAAEAGLRALSESLDGEWAADGIKIRCVTPGFVDRPLHDQPSAEGFEILPPEEVAKAAWDAVHGDRLHWLVGKDARRAAFRARWSPGKLRSTMRGLATPKHAQD